MPSQYNKNGGVWRTFIYYLTYVNMLTAFTIFNSTACRWCRCSTRRRNDSTLKIRYDAALDFELDTADWTGLKIYTIPRSCCPRWYRHRRLYRFVSAEVIRYTRIRWSWVDLIGLGCFSRAALGESGGRWGGSRRRALF